MGLSRRRFLSSTTMLGAAVAAGCTTRIGGSAWANPADVRRIEETPASGGLDIVHVGVIAFEPYTVGSGADLKGPIPDVARKILTDLGAPDVQFILLNDQEKILTALVAGQIEVAGGLVLQPQNCQNLKFSDPDFVSGTAFAVPAGNPKGLKTYAEVAAQGAKLAILTGSPEETDATTAGVPAGNLVKLFDPASLLTAVRDGQADCFAFDDISLRHMVKSFGQGVEVAAAFMPANRPPFVGAYAFPQDSELVESFNEKLKELHDSGEWLRMVEPFGFNEGNAPPADLTLAKACGN